MVIFVNFDTNNISPYVNNSKNKLSKYVEKG